MKKKIIALFALVLANSLYASWPMESVDKYNIVLVHGAADRWQGPFPFSERRTFRNPECCLSPATLRESGGFSGG